MSIPDPAPLLGRWDLTIDMRDGKYLPAWLEIRKSGRQTLVGLGLNRIRRTSTLPDTPAVRGMVAKVSHLVRVLDEA